MIRAAFPQQVHGIFEELDVPPLVTADADPLHILLNRCRDDLLHGTVVTQVNDLRPGGLENPANNIDRDIMAVEKAGRRHKTDLVLRLCGCFLIRRLLNFDISVHSVPPWNSSELIFVHRARLQVPF